jgi:hypothetical protein
VLDGVEGKSGGQLLVKTRNTIEIEGSEKPALIAEALALVIPTLRKLEKEGNAP